MNLSFQGIQKILLKGGLYLRNTKQNPTKNNDGVRATISSEIQPSDQVFISATTSPTTTPKNRIDQSNNRIARPEQSLNSANNPKPNPIRTI